MNYVTPTPQTVDQVCRTAYGDESGYVESVLDANPGLAALGLILPAGTRITLPDLPDQAKLIPVVTLWD
ncbi:P2-like prophage tail protein X [Loktanella atrilutea]|uniref:p2-like prophage tail protein X n=1 Tax=Loktanella atrilutea TaxID=366533 RepID=A0A1M4WEF7_LOKAT|nr:tail protein X [Loktanella atrilutea]SHE79594.1 P2-like prophage tail protein X [Loktanella atrilutea]